MLYYSLCLVPACIPENGHGTYKWLYPDGRQPGAFTLLFTLLFWLLSSAMALPDWATALQLRLNSGIRLFKGDSSCSALPVNLHGTLLSLHLTSTLFLDVASFSPFKLVIWYLLFHSWLSFLTLFLTSLPSCPVSCHILIDLVAITLISWELPQTVSSQNSQRCSWSIMKSYTETKN